MCSLEEPPGVGDVERVEGDGGNRRGPPRPGTLRSGAGARRPSRVLKKRLTVAAGGAWAA